jgi:outer membrane protein assembly factor BamB
MSGSGAWNRAVLVVTWILSIGTALFFLTLWLSYDPAANLTANMPGTDGRPAVMEMPEELIDLQGILRQFDGVPADLPGTWTRFRGPDFDNICKDRVPLADSWAEDGPAVLWSVDLGEGHAAPVVLNGRVYLIDYDETARADAVRCFSLADGKEIWRRSYTVHVKRNHGMSRTVPAVTEKYVVTIGPRCHVVCLDSITGEFRWGIDLQKEYGTTEPLWYTGQCPLIDGDQVILAPCGPETLMIAVDCETGSVVWKTPNPNGWNMSHSSIAPMTIAGTRMYVYCAIGATVGVAAEGERRGKLLWEVPWNARVVAPSPVGLEGGRIFLTAGYGSGNMMLQVEKQDTEFSAEIIFKKPPTEGLASEMQTPIYYDGLLYGIMPKDAGALREQFVCYDTDGTLIWSSGKAKRFGFGPFLLADGKFYVMSDDGVLTLLKRSRNEYIQLDEARILDGHDAWGPIAIANDRMLLRDSKKMVCINVGATKRGA